MNKFEDETNRTEHVATGRRVSGRISPRFLSGGIGVRGIFDFFRRGVMAAAATGRATVRTPAATAFWTANEKAPQGKEDGCGYESADDPIRHRLTSGKTEPTAGVKNQKRNQPGNGTLKCHHADRPTPAQFASDGSNGREARCIEKAEH